jgi:hypothetical protein
MIQSHCLASSLQAYCPPILKRLRFPHYRNTREKISIDGNWVSQTGGGGGQIPLAKPVLWGCVSRHTLRLHTSSRVNKTATEEDGYTFRLCCCTLICPPLSLVGGKGGYFQWDGRIIGSLGNGACIAFSVSCSQSSQWSSDITGRTTGANFSEQAVIFLFTTPSRPALGHNQLSIQ